ncbi:tRNA pseudouridine(55) synthase TruB [Sphingomonas lacunae]|uniref:tRNA pseudouridine synthase B n=1 Tax=Sphingomonas lacunae TaxID=2698828 RepID=A0A6M4ARU2_9SPHN|nr:tRNA pseudouridine(55) synthase TruB [Sphingomonas lacunae]QJQ31774.1 tRNA pseudouridine(55) synthase TruB [Sphingomonas lacunae]
MGRAKGRWRVSGGERDGPALHGWMILDKPLGLGSTQGVSAVKRALREGGYAKLKVGHGGTLDPLATGVLPVALGEATKLAGRMLDASKVYDFTIGFGTQTSGLDAEGEIVATSEVRPTLTDVQSVLPRFTGLIEQVPPVYSAIKIDGQRAYDRARAGEDVPMAARAVTIHTLCVKEKDGPSASPARADLNGAPLDSITLTAHVSKGTYIRSLARDIALTCGTVGHVTMLRRVRAGPFGLDQAISLDKLADMAKARSLEEVILPLEAGLDGIPALSLAPGEARLIRQGRTLPGQSVDDGLYLAMDGDVPVALVTVHAGVLAVERGFNL